MRYSNDYFSKVLLPQSDIFNQGYNNNPLNYMQQEESGWDKFTNLFSNMFNGNNNNPNDNGVQQPTMLGQIGQGVKIGGNIANIVGGIMGLSQGRQLYKQQKEMNKLNMENARLANEAGRLELENRKHELARLNKIRNNTQQQLTNSNFIKTNY